MYWIDVFTRQVYFSVLTESLDYCRKEKGMEIYAYCLMPSHIHLLFRASRENPSDLVRDFKGFTARKMIRTIEQNLQESRKEWLLWMFEKAGRENSNIIKYQFWQQHNKPIELWTDKVIQQKMEYIHNNPVVSGFVMDPTHWKYSSARNYQDDHTILEIDSDGFLYGLVDSARARRSR